MDWSKVLSTPVDELSADALKSAVINLPLVDPDALSDDELREFFSFSCKLIDKFANKSQSAKYFESNDKSEKESTPRKKLLKGSDTDESHYIQTIQELNREIAQYVYNNKSALEVENANVASNADAESLQPLTIDTKKDLLYKIHTKNKYIKRLLSENDALKEETERQSEQILLLNVSLKQTAHKLTKAIGDLLEQKKRNHMTADDMADLHAKINTVREQMTRIEHDKQKYKHDVLYLGDEIQKKINQWNEMLKKKYSEYSSAAQSNFNVGTIGASGKCHGNESNVNQAQCHFSDGIDIDQRLSEENHFEINILSQAIAKRNAIISEMEMLLIDLTMEISQSAVVINRIIKNLSQRETNFAVNLEKLRNHLAKLLDRPNMGDNNSNSTQNTLQAPPAVKLHNKMKLLKKKKEQGKEISK